ncbi:MAG: hypothetical protein MI975_00795 [Cytophagales bacterium]|nr:hypothetical protein [Cytophagales bacterium]
MQDHLKSKSTIGYKSTGQNYFHPNVRLSISKIGLEINNQLKQQHKTVVADEVERNLQHRCSQVVRQVGQGGELPIEHLT